MTISEKEQKQSKKKDQGKPHKPKTEFLSESDIKSLMGMDRPIYKRHRGAFRQRN